MGERTHMPLIGEAMFAPAIANIYCDNKWRPATIKKTGRYRKAIRVGNKNQKPVYRPKPWRNCGQPEMLVYNKQHDGSIQLVAVEYPVPIPLMPGKAPQGFDGGSDNWTYSTEFNLWLLHAWVWEYNLQGIFNPTNPLVHLH